MATKKDDKIACVILRDFWDAEGVRHRQGEGYEATVDEALDGIEKGTLERVKK